MGWELEPGWTVAEGTLRGEGHRWVRSMAGPWQARELIPALRKGALAGSEVLSLSKGRRAELGSFVNPSHEPD